jgi:methylenetetrahydrofolate dehydrogenase (NADP+) / methenyltetrahydrofolate cyclohydrolase
MQILDGKVASIAIKNGLKGKIADLQALGRKLPHLAAVLVGNNPASETYVASKVKSCHEINMTSTMIRLSETVSEQQLLDCIRDLNENDSVDGILVQLPLPGQIAEERVINAIRPEKDIDGFHPVNIGNMVLGFPSFISATPLGIILLLQHYKIDITGRHVVVIGRSNIVGTPISILLSRNTTFGNATVTLCHSRTKDLGGIARQADILIAAIGRPKFVTAGMVKEDAVVIDVGINRVKDASKKSGYALTGDVDFEQVAPKTSFITPVPGGVGLMTIAALLTNTYEACTRRHP